MNTKTIKVAEATNTQLDWLVAECEGHGDRWLSRWREGGDKRFVYCEVVYKYSERPEQMWPIIERERIGLSPWGERGEWLAYTQRDRSSRWFADSAMRAAAGCYVISKLGETVEVPEELT